MNFHYINSRAIITNVKHGTDRGSRTDDFFIISVNHWEAAQFLGRLYVDEDSMMTLLKWAEDNTGDFILLISIDGRFGAVVPGIGVGKPDIGSKIIELSDDFVAPISRVRTEFRKYLGNHPEIAEQLNLSAFQKAIPERTVFRTGSNFGPGVTSSEVGDAVNNIESASDDALVWIKMLGLNPERGLTEDVVEKALRELKLRIDKGYGLHPRFFPVKEVTMKEIEARGRRARRTLESFLKKFPIERDLDFTEEQKKERKSQVERYAARLTNDRLVELVVFLSFKAEWLGDTYKHLLGEFYDRAARGGE